MAECPGESHLLVTGTTRNALPLQRLMLINHLLSWESILWSDESKFNMFGSDGRSKVWRASKEAFLPECLKPTVKYGGGSVMVWGCMSAKGVGKLHFIEGIIYAEVYENILAKQMIPSAENLLGHRYTFQHENDPKYTWRSVSWHLWRANGSTCWNGLPRVRTWTQ